jgi:DNA helicase-2/ATP-dependent DNA helicase PcrA
MLDLSMLNEEQIKAVQHMEGPLAVVANPGSGKTRVIVYRILNLIENGVAPANILACSFTKKSARELSIRLEGHVGEDANGISVSTLHSTAFSILRRFENRGSSKLNIVKMFDIWNFFDRIIKANPKYKLKDIKRIISFISYQKLELRRPSEVEKLFEDFTKDEALDLTNSQEICLLEYYSLYEAWLRENRSIDFSDMLMRTYYHLADPKNAEKTKQIVSKIDYLLVDEAQDANKASYEIYKILGSKSNNIMLTGDPKQSIYSFQGSSYDYLFDFIKDYKTEFIDLPLNYRSTKAIINASNALIQKDPFFKDSVTITTNGEGEPVSVFTSEDEMDEAVNITEAVARLVHSGYKYSDIGILYRVNAQAIPISDSLTMNEIPFTVINVSSSFYKRAEIKKVVAYIKILIDPNLATLADFLLVYNCPTRYIKAVTMKEFVDNDYETYWQAMTDKVHDMTNWQQQKAVKTLINVVLEGVVAVQEMDTRQVLHYVLLQCGFDHWLRNDTFASDETESSSDEDRHMNIEVLEGACTHRPIPMEFVDYAEGTGRISKSCYRC